MINYEDFFRNNDAYELIQFAKQNNDQKTKEKVQEKIRDLKAKGFSQDTFSKPTASDVEVDLRLRTYERFGRSNEKDYVDKAIEKVNAIIYEMMKPVSPEIKELEDPLSQDPLNLEVKAKEDAIVFSFVCKSVDRTPSALNITKRTLDKIYTAYCKQAKVDKLSNNDVFSVLLNEVKKESPDNTLELFKEMPKESLERLFHALADSKNAEKFNTQQLVTTSMIANKLGLFSLVEKCNLILNAHLEKEDLSFLQNLLKEIQKSPFRNEPLENELEKVAYEKMASKIKTQLNELETKRWEMPKSKQDREILSLIIDLMQSPHANRNKSKTQDFINPLIDQMAANFTKVELERMQRTFDVAKKPKRFDYFMNATIRQWENSEALIKKIENKKLDLERVTPEMKCNKRVVLAAVKERGLALSEASDAHKNDKDVVLAAVCQDPDALEIASDILKNDKDVVLAALKQPGDAFQYASDALKNDKNFVLTAVRNNKFALEHASDILKNDKDVVLVAVNKNALALEHASDILKNDKDVVLAAFVYTGIALQYASDALKNDKDVVLAAVRRDPNALEFASDALKNDRDVILAARGR